MKKFLFILILPLFITGCWDKVEIENRGFVISLGIDKFDDEKAVQMNDGQKPRYTVTIALPNVGELMGSGSKENSEFVKDAASPTVAGAMRLLDSVSSELLYFGHTKVVFLGEELLKDEKLFREALDALERNREVSRNLLVLATSDDVKDILDAKIPGEPMVGAYIAKFYRNNEGSAITFKQNLEKLTRKLRDDGDALIPIISLEGEEEARQVKLGGAAVIKDFSLVSTLDDSQTRAYMWFLGKAKGALIQAEYNGEFVPVRINASQAKTRFYEDNGQIVCRLEISARAAIEEFDFAEAGINNEAALSELSRICERLVADEISQLFEKFHGELDVDGLGLNERLHKQAHLLHAAYGDEAYKAMVLVPVVNLEITGAGVIK